MVTLGTLWHTLIEPWESGIDRRALVEIVLLGVGGGVLGCWIVLYNLSYGAESLAHSLLPGLVLAAIAGVPLVLGGAAGMVVAAAGVAAVARFPGLERDTAVAVVVTPLLGLGAVLALSPQIPAGLGELLFGDILGVTNGDLVAAAALCLGLLAVLWVAHGRLLAAGFDRSSASSLGISAARTDLLLLGLIAVALLVAVQGLGNLLVVAVLVAPAATARSLARRMPAMMGVAAATAALAGVAGLYLSYYAGTAAGASIAGVLVLTYLAAALARPA